MIGWFYYGGGEALYRELMHHILRLNAVGFMSGPMPTQPLGWFRTPIERAEQIRGLRYRTIGLATDLFQEMGAAVVALSGGEVGPALERGVIDAAEFNNPSGDRVLGLSDVAKNYMLQSLHQNTECFEILFNRQRFEALPQELQQTIKYASELAHADMSWKQQDRYPKDLVALAQSGVTVRTTPRSILDVTLQAWDRVVARLQADASSPANGPFFRRSATASASGAAASLGSLPALPDQPGDLLQPLLRAPGLIRRASWSGAGSADAGPALRSIRGQRHDGSLCGVHPGRHRGGGDPVGLLEPGRRCSRALIGIDKLSTLVGQAGSWAIIVLTLAIVYDVSARRFFRAPTTWAYDVSYMLYGALFMLAGAYALSRNGHVRGDFLYRNFKPTLQAKFDLALYILFSSRRSSPSWCRAGTSSSYPWPRTSAARPAPTGRSSGPSRR